MIKARMTVDGTPVLVLGLSRQNLDRLMNDQPILINGEMLRDLGFPNAPQVMLMAGETEEDCRRELQVLAVHAKTLDKVEFHQHGDPPLGL